MSHDDEFSRLSANDDGLGTLLRAAKREAPPAGLEGRLATRLGVPLVGIAATVPTATAATAAMKTLSVAKIAKLAALGMLGVGLGAGLGIGGLRVAEALRGPTGGPAPSVVPNVVPSTAPNVSPTAVPTVNAPPVVSAATVASLAPLGGSAPAAVPTPVPEVLGSDASSGRDEQVLGTAAREEQVLGGADRLAEEAALLTEARRAMAHGDLAGARRALASHQTQFPKGALALERSVIALEIRAKSGDSTAAKAAGALANDPAYRPYKARLQALAGGP